MKENKTNPRIHIGETHGIYTLIDVLDKKDKYGKYIYVGKCNECGYEKYSFYADFTCRIATVCNHIRAGINKPLPKMKWDNKRIEYIFKGMKQRCYNKNNKCYKWYGGKGIKICDEWLNNPKSFEEWSLQNGYTDNLTIDRIDEDKDYSPDNCKWITDINNAKYKSTTSMINVDGEVHTGRDWANVLGLSTNIINKYIRRYGLDNVTEFIRRYLKNPNLKPFKKNQSIYNVYMN